MERLPTTDGDEPTLELSAEELWLEHGIRLQPDPREEDLDEAG